MARQYICTIIATCMYNVSYHNHDNYMYHVYKLDKFTKKKFNCLLPTCTNEYTVYKIVTLSQKIKKYDQKLYSYPYQRETTHVHFSKAIQKRLIIIACPSVNPAQECLFLHPSISFSFKK